MAVHYTNRRRLDAAAEAPLGATYHATIEDLLPQCGVLSLHCPATAETKGLLNAELLALLPRDAIGVNTASGALVDDDAHLAERMDLCGQWKRWSGRVDHGDRHLLNKKKQ